MLCPRPSLGQHPYSTDKVQDSLGTGRFASISSTWTIAQPLFLLQRITIYADRPWILTGPCGAGSTTGRQLLETRDISPAGPPPCPTGASCTITGSEPRILDEPFDNDDWVGAGSEMERHWPDDDRHRLRMCIGIRQYYDDGNGSRQRNARFLENRDCLWSGFRNRCSGLLQRIWRRSCAGQPIFAGRLRWQGWYARPRAAWHHAGNICTIPPGVPQRRNRCQKGIHRLWPE